MSLWDTSNYYKAYASDLGDIEVKHGEEEAPGNTSVGDWRLIFTGPRSQCQIVANAYKMGFMTSELGEWEGGSATFNEN